MKSIIAADRIVFVFLLINNFKGLLICWIPNLVLRNQLFWVEEMFTVILK